VVGWDQKHNFVQGWTAVRFATVYGHIAVAKFLVSHGCNLNTRHSVRH
jgi:ankyrin repeat protein